MKAVLLSTALLIYALPTFACEAHEKLAMNDHSEHHGMNMEGSSGSSSGTGGSSDIYAQSRMDMHKDMDVKPSGDADLDFVNNMIPHHQGAIDMAAIQLKHGKNPELRKLAKNIIKAQEAEIKMMQDWQKKLQN